jgi:hypothetical protein
LSRHFSGDKLAERNMEEMRRELCGSDASPLERMLVERIVLCWFYLNSPETSYGQNAASMSMA